MRLRNQLLVGAAAFMLVGCAHQINQSPGVTWVPDEFRANQVMPPQTPATTQARQAARIARQATTPRATASVGRVSLGGAAMLSPAANEPRQANQAAPATDAPKKTFNMLRLNWNMIVKSGAFASGAMFSGAGEKPSAMESRRNHGFAAKGSKNHRLSSVRVSERTKKNPGKGMLLVVNLVKMVGAGRPLDLKDPDSHKTPAQLNMGMLVKSGAFACWRDSPTTYNPKVRGIPEQVTHVSNRDRVPFRLRDRRAKAKYRARLRISKREMAGGRCAPNDDCR